MKQGRNRKVYTGLPFGTFKYGDKHPEQELWFKWYEESNGTQYEKWADAGAMERSRMYHEYKKNPKPKPSKDWPKLQTGSKRGTFKSGDLHPSYDRVFQGYTKDDRELWLNPETHKNLLSSIKASAKRRSKKKAAARRHIVAQNDAFRHEQSVRNKAEKDYANKYTVYGAREYRAYVRSKKELTPEKLDEKKANRKKNRRRVRENNPAKWAAEKKERKHKVQMLWDELNKEQRRQSNSRYKWRDYLNSLHGRTVFVVDHVKPVCRGGKQNPENLRVTTYDYNEWKAEHDKTPGEFDPSSYAMRV